MDWMQRDWLLRGESIEYAGELKFLNCSMSCFSEKSMGLLVAGGRIDGQLIITNYRLLYEATSYDENEVSLVRAPEIYSEKRTNNDYSRNTTPYSICRWG